MRKVFVILISLMMLFAFTACENNANTPTDHIVLYDEVELATEGVKFVNAEGVSISSSDGYNYKVTGDLASMSAAQATSFNGAGITEGALFIAVNIPEFKGQDGNDYEVRRGWVSAENATKAADELVDGDFFDKRDSATFDSYGYGLVLAITKNATELRDENHPVWRGEYTKDGNTIVFTIDLSEQVKAVQDAASN